MLNCGDLRAMLARENMSNRYGLGTNDWQSLASAKEEGFSEATAASISQVRCDRCQAQAFGAAGGQVAVDHSA